MALLDTSRQYSPGDLAGYAGGAGETWNGKEFFFGGEKYVIRDNGNGTRSLQQMTPTANDVKSGKAFGGNTKQILVDEISKQLIELENKYNSIPGVSLTAEEQEAFLNKALDEITPYYEAKKAEIEKGIKEGFLRTAEDTLNLIRQVSDEVTRGFQKYDIDQAQTEEEFVNKIADITASEGEAVDSKRFEWKQRLNDAKQTLTQKGIIDSGIGMKQLRELQARQSEEQAAVERRAQQAVTDTQSTKKWSLERIAIARQAITDERKRRIGDPETTSILQQKARETLGLGANKELSEAEILAGRQERNQKVYDPTALTSLEEERRTALETTAQDLKQNELDIRSQEEKRQRQAIEAEMANKRSQLSSYS